jgi:hypothetical protein
MMKDCQTFIKLQEAAGSKQTEARNQGYAGTWDQQQTMHHYNIHHPRTEPHKDKDNKNRVIKTAEVTSRQKGTSLQ